MIPANLPEEDANRKFAEAAGPAFMAARSEAIAGGQTLVEVVDDEIVRIFPDGNREVIRKIVHEGTTLTSRFLLNQKVAIRWK